MYGPCCGQCTQPTKGGGIAEGETNNQHFFDMVKVSSINEGPRIQKFKPLKCFDTN